MCGICGFFTKEKIDLGLLKKMNDTMFHRGPNDSGEEIYDVKKGYSLGLAQRRLSIQDLSSLGHQPMHSSDRRLSLVFNGEIYNFLELRDELSDYEFKSNCDTEVIIASYLKWGIDCVNHFNGMFAIAIFDRKIGKLFLVRDRFGKKPLYYWIDGENIVFASELKPIMAVDSFHRDINKSIMGRYLTRGYISAPDSIFNNVYKLLPGTVLEYEYGEIKIKRYWDNISLFSKCSSEKIKSYDEAKECLKTLIVDSVKKRMISDVPVGAFLSGGYDSALVTAVAQSMSDKPIKTFSVGFKDFPENEAEHAKRVAEYLGTDHTEKYMEASDMLGLFEDCVKYFDEPFATTSELAVMLVSEMAKKDVTVVLSGDGGDELFCGYYIYKGEVNAQKFDAIGSILRSILSLTNENSAKFLNKIPDKIRTVIDNNDIRYKTQFDIMKYENVSRYLVADSQPVRFEETDYLGVRNWQERRMLLDQNSFLVSILDKVDRSTMKYSLENRCPLLDYRIAEYSYHMPMKFKYKDGVKKRILKDIAYDYIPYELLERPKKGFSVPVNLWFEGEFSDRMYEYLNQKRLEDQGIFNPRAINDYIRGFLKNGDTKTKYFNRVVYPFFVFQMWYDEYIKR